MTMRSFVDLGARLYKREMHHRARMLRSAQKCNFGRDGKVIEAKKENEGEGEDGAGTREGEKKSRTLNRPLALSLKVKRYDRRSRRIGEREEEGRAKEYRMNRGTEKDGRKEE